MMSSIRRRIALVGVMAIAATSLSSVASAQDSGGGWGFEGRAAGGNGAYIVRHFSPNWSMLAGGGLDYIKNDRKDSNGSFNRTISGNVSVIFRRTFGSGVVQPLFGFGPTINISNNKSETTNPPNQQTQTTETTGIGGRAEFGGLVSVTQRLKFGLLANLTGTRSSNKSTSSINTSESKTTITQLNIGAMQFVGSIRF